MRAHPVPDGVWRCALPDQDPQPGVQSTGCLAALIRLTWVFGNFGLVITALSLAKNHSLMANVGLFGTAAALIAVRYVDIVWFHGETAAGGTRATLSDWRRHATAVTAATIVLWLAARIVASRGWL